MKINKISMAMMAAASLLATSPAVFAQTNNAGGAAPAAPAAPGGRARGGPLTIEAIDKAVTLTDAEKPKVKAALEEQTTAMQAARGETDQTQRRAKATAAREEFTKKMKEILTPEQFTKFQAIAPQGGRRG